MKFVIIIIISLLFVCGSLTLRYKLYCEANYYSSDCSVYCVARDSDTHGHYTCDPATGSIICRRGMLISEIHLMLLFSLLGPFHGVIAVPSVTRCRCRRRRCGHRTPPAL